MASPLERNQKRVLDQSKLMAAVRHCPSWADLHPELVALVLKRLPRHADRVRLGAVCRAWRVVVQQEPALPSLPWLTLLDGSFLTIPDGEVLHRMRVPGDVSIHGSVGRWLFLRRCLSGELLLMNHFSKRIVPLPIQASADETLFLKLVPLSSTPSDLLPPDSLFAVLVVITATRHKFMSAISICRRSSASAPATTFRVYKHIADVICFKGKLYALSNGELFILEVVSGHGSPRISSMARVVASAVEDQRSLLYQQLTEDGRYEGSQRNYLVESRGKLLRVRRLFGWLSNLPLGLRMERTRTLSFEVFEFDDSGHEWRRIYTLGNQALFIGPNSKSRAASKCGAQEDCIYFVCDYDHENWTTHPLRDCGVFDMSGRIAPLLLDGAVVRPQAGRKGCATWFFPPKVV